MLRSARQGRPATLLIGAGCSISGGIPSAAEIVKRYRGQYEDDYARAEKNYLSDHPEDNNLAGIYPYFMSEIAPADRDGIINELIQREKINWTHLVIAHLIKNKYFGRVLTVNFDRLALKSAAFLNIFPSIYDRTAIKLAFEQNVISEQEGAIFYLHGQGQAMPLTHRHEDSERHTGELSDFLRDSLQRGPVIVVGYSGQSDPVFKLFLRQQSFRHGLYWVSYEEAIHDHIQELMSIDGATFLSGHDSDRFFISLSQHLNCFPPEPIADPLNFISEIFNEISPFPNASESSEARVNIGEIEKDYVDPLSIARKIISDSISENPKIEYSKIELAFMHNYMLGDHQAAIITAELIPDEMRSEELKAKLAEMFMERAISALAYADESLGVEMEFIESDADKALTLHPSVEIKNDYLHVKMTAANLLEGKDRKDKLLELQDVTHDIEKNGKNLYNVACMHSQMGRSDKCLRALKHVIESGHYTNGQIREGLLKDKDLDFARSQPWFEDLVQQVSKSASGKNLPGPRNNK